LKRPVRPITASYLQNAAAFYLERYPATAEKLRRILSRRVARAKAAEAPIMDGVEQAIDALIDRLVAAGAVDDSAFAQTKARALHRRGTSTRAMRHKLRLAGVDGATLERAMVALDGELDVDPEQREWRAAVALARRRRLGPFRAPGARPERRDRDLAAMARAGFALDVARKVIDARDAESLDVD